MKVLCLVNQTQSPNKGRLVRIVQEVGQTCDVEMACMLAGISLVESIESLPIVSGAIEYGEQWLEEQIPFAHWERRDSNSIRLIFISHVMTGPKSLHFLCELATQWLVPGQELPLVCSRSTHFEIPSKNKRQFFYGEVTVANFRDKELIQYRDNLPVVLEEVKLVARYDVCAAHLLQGRGLGMGRKNRDVHQETLRLTAERGTELILSALEEVHRFLVLSGECFRNVRSAKLLSRIAASFLWLEPKLAREEMTLQEGHRIRLRLLAANLTYPFGTKLATGVSLVARLDPQYELLDEEHVRSAVARVLPGASIVRGSFLSMPGGCEQVRKLYFEVDLQGRPMKGHERRLLLDSLPREIQTSIEQLVNAIFIQRNEELILRGIIALYREVQKLSDTPIMMTEFQGQEGSELTFSVILVRPVDTSTPPLVESLSRLPCGTAFVMEEERVMGVCSQGGKKSASVFRLSLEKSPFLRKNQSIDLQKAQRHVAAMIRSVVGDVRDFRGGIVDRRAEDLEAIKTRLSREEAYHELLLENLFHALSPRVMQSYLADATLHRHFQTVLRAMAGEGTQRRCHRMLSESEGGVLHIVLICRDGELARAVLPALSKLTLPPLSLAHALYTVGEGTVLSLVFKLAEATTKEQILAAIGETMTAWEEGQRSRQVLRVCIPRQLSLLDPRVGTDRRTGVLMRMLYEGLMRIGRDGRASLGIAERVDISPDRKHYTFYLRASNWSDGSPVTAHDYEYAWKTALNPNFKAVRAFLFSPIKNAMAAKRGEVSLDEVGVRAESDSKLVVELGKPTPYFLDLTSHWCFSPVPDGIDAREPEWAAYHKGVGLANGPFKLDAWGVEEIRVVKNPHYWDAGSVSLQAIELAIILDPHAAWRAYEEGKLDWIGEPVSELPVDLISRLRKEGRLESIPVAAVDWYKLNTRVPPFSSRAMRKAFACAVNRRQIIDETLWGDEEPALTCLPPFLSLARKGLIRDGDVELAKALFEEGLKELGMQREQLEPLVLAHSTLQEDGATVQAAARQWERCFGVKTELREIPWDDYLNFTLTQDFQAASVTWYSWFNDPIYTLQHLKRRGKNANATGWEHPRFVELLNKADSCLDLEQRREFLREAEELYLEEMPLIPISMQRHRYVKRKDVAGICLTPLGQIDFRWAVIESQRGEFLAT